MNADSRKRLDIEETKTGFIVRSEAAYKWIPLANLREASVNPRRSMNDAKMQELVESIKAKGILTPLLVRQDNNSGARANKLENAVYEIAAGHRRYRAAKLAGLQEVPAIVREMTDTEFLEIITIENLQREDVHPLDEAQGYRALMDQAGYDVDGIAAKVGKSPSYIYQRLKLAELVPDGQKLFLEDKITAGHAILIARLQPKNQQEALKYCFDHWDKTLISTRHLADWIDQMIHLDLNSASFSKKDPDLVPEAGPCTSCPKRTGFAPALFPDIKKKDTCTDPTCFNQKLGTFLIKKTQKLEEDSDQVLKLSSESTYYGRKKKKDAPLYRGEYTEIGKKGEHCESTRQGILVEGRERGKVLDVCADPNCKVHRGRGRGQTAEDKAYKARAKAEQEKRALNFSAREAILDGILAASKGKFDQEDFKLMAEVFFGALWHEYQKKILRRKGLKPVKEQYSQNTVIPIRKWINGETADLHGHYADTTDLQRFLLEVALFPRIERDWTEKKKDDPLLTTAKRYKVDPQKIEARVRAEAKAKQKKPAKAGEETSQKVPCLDCANDSEKGGGCHREKFHVNDDGHRLICESKKKVQTPAKKKKASAK